MEVNRDGSRVVLEICNLRQRSAQTIRVYDLVRESILQEWKFGTGCFFRATALFPGIVRAQGWLSLCPRIRVVAPARSALP